MTTRHSFIQMTKLSNVRGRITYISSHAKQEHLYAVYETTERSYWTELARCSQQEFKKSGVEGKCIEARELIIALPESLFEQGMPNIVLRSFTDKFKEKYGVECVAALHHNKRMTNFHIHLIFSERQLLAELVIKTATRNMFYDERGNHVRTKKEILDEAGNIRKRCKVIKKGEIYEKKLFTSKNTRFKQEDFLDEVKLFYTRMINRWVTDEKDRLTVFDRNGPYLAKDGNISSWAIGHKDSKVKSFLQNMSEKAEEILQKQLEKAKDTKEEKEVFSMKKHKEVIKKNKVDLKV